MITATSTIVSGQHRRHAPAKAKSLRRFWGVIVLAILALLYIAQAAQTSTKSAEAHNLQRQATELKSEVEQLQLDSVRAQSLDVINLKAGELGLQPIDSVEYLNQ